MDVFYGQTVALKCTICIEGIEDEIGGEPYRVVQVFPAGTRGQYEGYRWIPGLGYMNIIRVKMGNWKGWIRLADSELEEVK